MGFSVDGGRGLKRQRAYCEQGNLDSSVRSRSFQGFLRVSAVLVRCIFCSAVNRVVTYSHVEMKC